MKKYNNYKLTEKLRIDTTVLTEDKTIDLIIQNCKEFIDKPEMIFRGVNADDDFLLIDPKLIERNSSTNTNQYNLIIDNTWEGYPKRKNSLCCTSDEYIAEQFAPTIYYVIPFDNSKWALSPDTDLWASFEKISIRYNLALDTFFKILNRVYSYYYPNDEQLDHIIDFELYKNSINKLNAAVISDCSENGFDVVNDKIAETNKAYFNFEIKKILTDLNKDNFFETLVKIMNPTDNGFSLMNYKNMIVYSDIELWTDSKCILIEVNKYDDLYNKIKTKYEEI
jgi:hypothetical protein